MRREVDTGRPFESRLHIDYNTQLRSTSDPHCCFMAILSLRNPPRHRIMRNLWSNTRERPQSKEQEQAEDSSYSKGIEALPRETARNGYPDQENVDNPMIAPGHYEVRQSGRVLELQNKDLWIRPTDLSCHFPILVTFRELPIKNYRGRSITNLEATDESKMQKNQKNISQIKHTGIQFGSHSPIGNGILYIDFLGKVIHDDEDNVCLSRTTTFHHYCHLPF